MPLTCQQHGIFLFSEIKFLTSHVNQNVLSNNRQKCVKLYEIYEHSCTTDKDIWYFIHLSWDRNSFLTHFSYRGCHVKAIHWLLRLELAHIFIKWRHHVILHLSVFRDSGSLFKIKKSQWWARKEIYYSCEGGIETSVPHKIEYIAQNNTNFYTFISALVNLPHTKVNLTKGENSLTSYLHHKRRDP